MLPVTQSEANNKIYILYPGVIILTVSGGYQSQEMGRFPFNPPLSG